MTALTIRVPTHLKSELDVLAQQLNVTVSEVVRNVLQQHIETKQKVRNTDLQKLAELAHDLPTSKNAPQELAGIYKIYLYGEAQQ